MAGTPVKAEARRRHVAVLNPVFARKQSPSRPYARRGYVPCLVGTVHRYMFYVPQRWWRAGEAQGEQGRGRRAAMLPETARGAQRKRQADSAGGTRLVKCRREWNRRATAE